VGLDIGITVKQDRSGALDPRWGIALDDDGYYWYLYPLFEELHSQTGEMIDLYGDALFKGETLLSLQRIVQKALEIVRKQPPEWEVLIGWYGVSQEQIFSKVSKETFVSLPERFEHLIDRAIQENEFVVCLGD
jgi:hypothetical protein